MIWLFLIIFSIVVVVIFILIMIFGYPRKECSRIPNNEDLFDEDVAKSFQRMTNFLPFRILHGSVIKVLKKINPKGNLVDIGCGTGNVLVRIAKEIPALELTGVDNSSEILELAKKRAINNNLNIEFKIGDAENLPFSNNSIDYMVSTLSLHHWLQPKKVIDEIYRVLKKDGTFIIFDFRRDARKFFHGFLRFATKVVVPKPLKRIKEPIGSLLASYTVNEITEIMAQTPFKNVKIKPFLAWMFISNKEL
ncbi:MAG: methyltransferase domain-containing protein [Candidatus Lokiarchaeota archaeon]|nr:methyltransferase domain-containing protein [Candidatus Lokiarchaeota archaeon]